MENDGWTYKVVGPDPDLIDVDINGEQTFIMVTVQPTRTTPTAADSQQWTAVTGRSGRGRPMPSPVRPAALAGRSKVLSHGPASPAGHAKPSEPTT
ncbi:hypothetical protein BX265_2304 [Streptomyces sp. TLI_235]|nr:hypothetical protein [Streptomyces sp. TLI_235]PBC77553.1 hypothetical protein BX265_2304 [Streptomyces sp. TLI_235]